MQSPFSYWAKVNWAIRHNLHSTRQAGLRGKKLKRGAGGSYNFMVIEKTDEQLK